LPGRAGQTWDALLVIDGPESPVGALRAATRDQGIAAAYRLGLTVLPARDLDPVSVSAQVRRMLAGYARIFVPNLGRDGSPSIVAAAPAGIAHDGLTVHRDGTVVRVWERAA
jgi:hypothetical protein